MVIDGAGNMYLVGHNNGAGDYDPGPGEYIIASPQGTCICKLNADGDLQWVNFLSLGGGFGGAVALDGTGNVYIAGGFSSVSVDFDPGPGVFMVTGVGNSNGVVLKLDASGTFQWVKTMGTSSSRARYHDIVIDESGNIYLAGWYDETVDVDPGSGVYNLTSDGDYDAFVSKLDNMGEFQWARSVGGLYRDDGSAVTVDNDGNVYLSGYFFVGADLDPGPGTFTVTGPGGDSAFVLKLDGAGGFLWASALGGTDDVAGYGIQIDSMGNVYTLGRFTSDVDLDPGPGTVPFSSSEIYNAYLSKLDSGGEFAWGTVLPSAELNESGNALTIDGLDNVFLTGSFQGTLDFDPGTDVVEVSSYYGYRDAFILKLEQLVLPNVGDDLAETPASQVLTELTVPPSSSVLSNDSEGNSTASLVVTAYDAISVYGAAVSVNTDGSFVYDPTGVPAFQALAAGEVVVDSFTYTVGVGTDSVTGTVRVTVYDKFAGLPAVSRWGIVVLVLLVVSAGSIVSRRHRHHCRS